MTHPPHHVALANAGIATMNGGRRRGANALQRSGRQERKAVEAQGRQWRKALEAEVARIVREVGRATGEPVPLDDATDDAYYDERCTRDPIFAAAVDRIAALARNR